VFTCGWPVGRCSFIVWTVGHNSVGHVPSASSRPVRAQRFDVAVRELSLVERQVVVLLGQGHRVGSGATVLELPVAAVLGHIRRILDTLGLHSQAQLITLWRDQLYAVGFPPAQ